MPKNKMHILMNSLAEAARALSEEEVSAVLEGRARLIVYVEDVKRRKSDRHMASASEEREGIGLLEAADNLKGMTTREAGTSYLQVHFKNRMDLVRLARILDIPIRERDPRSKMEERIVDATIGFRLRSDAIQNRTEAEPAQQDRVPGEAPRRYNEPVETSDGASAGEKPMENDRGPTDEKLLRALPGTRDIG